MFSLVTSHTHPPDLLCLGERGWGCQIGVPDVCSALPLPASLFFPDLDVFALVGRRLAAGVAHGELIGAANETEITRFRDFDFGRFPTDNQTRAGEKIAPELLDRVFCGRDWRVWWQHAGVIGVVSNCFL